MTDLAAHPERADQDPETGRFVVGNQANDLYDPAYCDQARKLAKLGATFAEIADFFEVSLRTITNWRNQHAEFAEAIRIGGEHALDRIETSLYARAVGYDYTEEVAIKIKVGKDLERVEVVEVRKHQPADAWTGTKVLVAKGREEWRDKRDVNFNGKMIHYTPEQARQELIDFFSSEDHPLLIEGQAVEIEQP